MQRFQATLIDALLDRTYLRVGEGPGADRYFEVRTIAAICFGNGGCQAD